MMNGRAFRDGIERRLVSLGFAKKGKSVSRHLLDCWTIVGVENSVGAQWVIDVGFVLDALDGTLPERVSLAHMYFRLERLFPEHHETIAVAGSMTDPNQGAAYEALLQLLSGEIDQGLRALGTEAGLRAGLAEGRLVAGLVRREARDFLVV